MTFAVVEKHSEGYVLKPLKQKLFVDGLSYLLQEIYGIENKKADNAKVRLGSRAGILNLSMLLGPPLPHPKRIVQYGPTLTSLSCQNIHPYLEMSFVFCLLFMKVHGSTHVGF